MKVAAFELDGTRRLGLVDGAKVCPLPMDKTSGPDPMIDLIARWGEVGSSLEQAAGEPLPLDAVRLLPPVWRPGKTWAIGLNYADHVEESGVEAPTEQVWFTKAVTSLNGPFDPVQIPKVSQYVDYEVELVAVVGKGGRHIAAAEAGKHIFGYCVGNDVTERAWQHRVPQWSLGKSFDTHGPIGPWITTADEVDPHTLDISCTVNGEVRQSSNTRNLIFNVYEQIEHLSSAMTLEPGDLIFTGTCGGIGAAMKPMRFLEPGDTVRCEIAGLGHIEAVMESEE